MSNYTKIIKVNEILDEKDIEWKVEKPSDINQGLK